MKAFQKLIIMLAITLAMASCKDKVEEIKVITNPVGTDTGVKDGSGTVTTALDFTKMKKLVSGDFMSSPAHVTTGKVQIYENTNGLRYLVFETVKGDNGPDLRLYLATDTKATGFIEVSNKISYGTAYYEIPKAADLSKQNYALIWCQQFSVLFGSVQLK
jgi:hypothetical protein